MPEPRLFDVAAALGRHPAHDVGDGSPAALLAELDRLGIDAAVVTHTAATHHHPATGNARLAAETAGQPRLHACATLLPPTCGEPPAQAAMLTARPRSHGYDLTGPDMAPHLAAAADHGTPLLLEAGEVDWADVARLATEHPDLPLVVTDLGYRELRRVCGLLQRHPRLHVGTANLSGHLTVEYLVERFGAHRLVFGTGQPVRDPGEAVTRLLWSELDDDAVRAVGGGTLRALLGLP